MLGLAACVAMLAAIACGSEAEPTPTAASEVGESTRVAEPTATPTEESPPEPFVIGAMDALTGVAESYGNPLH